MADSRPPWYHNRNRTKRGIPGDGAPETADPTANPTEPSSAAFGDTFYPVDGSSEMGGGLTAPSDQDSGSWGRTADQEEGGDWKTERAALDMTYADPHSFAGPTDRPVDPPYDGQDPKKLLERFAEDSFDGARRVRDVPTITAFNSITLLNNEIIPLLGPDRERKSVTVWPLKANTGNILIGNENNMGNAAVVGAGVSVLEPGQIQLVLEGTGSIAVTLGAAVVTPQVLCYVVTRYSVMNAD